MIFKLLIVYTFLYKSEHLKIKKGAVLSIKFGNKNDITGYEVAIVDINVVNRG